MVRFSCVAGFCGALLVAGVAFAGGGNPPKPENPWVAMTRMDLQAMHDELAANHPGAVDPANPGFVKMLNDGLAKAQARADGVRCYDDYLRVMNFYRVQFRDNHIQLGRTSRAVSGSWPGFLIWGRDAKSLQVVAAEPDAGVGTGAKLISCDGKSADQLLAERVDPFYWPHVVPHGRTIYAEMLFMQSEADPRPKLKSCIFSTGKVTLKWRAGASSDFKRQSRHATGRDRVPGLKQVDGVWMLSLPSFHITSGNWHRRMESLLQEMEAKAPEIRKGPLVIDVRGNGGGDGRWGDSVAERIWGKPRILAAMRKAMPNVRVGWRLSPADLKYLGYPKWPEKGVQTNATDAKLSHALLGSIMTLDWAADGCSVHAYMPCVKAALARHKDLFWMKLRAPGGSDAKLPPNPVSGKVWLLTDRSCASACLSFADTVLEMPDVTQIGMPTNADTTYMELGGGERLPSGLLRLHYSINLFSGRARGSRQWYSPKYRWPYDEPMIDDDKIIKWIKGLPK